MITQFSVHDVTKIELGFSYPSNGNSRTILITHNTRHGGEEVIPLTVYGRTEAFDLLPRAADFSAVGAGGERTSDAPVPNMLVQLRAAEAFIAGFEHDPLQEGIADLLTGIRAAIAKAEGRS